MKNRASVIALIATTSATAATIHVPGDQPTIQAGIDAAALNDTVFVAPGTYTGAGNKNLDFGGVDRVLLSEAGADATVIDCEGDGRGMYFGGGESESSVLEGFAVMRGDDYYGAGAGIRVDGSSPTLRHITISDCRGDVGGGITCFDAAPRIEGCTISDNRGFYEGGGMACYSSAPVLTHCTITNCGTFYSGGGLYCDGSTPTLINCIIAENTGGAYGGGGLFCTSDSAPLLLNCTIANNSAYDTGGIHSARSSPVLVNCVLWGNPPREIQGGAPTLTYCNVRGGFPGEGNIDADPRFRSFAGFDYLLGISSPCIDTGRPELQDGVSDWHPLWPAGHVDGPRSDMGAYGGPNNLGWIR